MEGHIPNLEINFRGPQVHGCEAAWPRQGSGLDSRLSTFNVKAAGVISGITLAGLSDIDRLVNQTAGIEHLRSPPGYGHVREAGPDKSGLPTPPRSVVGSAGTLVASETSMTARETKSRDMQIGLAGRNWGGRDRLLAVGRSEVRGWNPSWGYRLPCKVR